jgi:hypothetical protein
MSRLLALAIAASGRASARLQGGAVEVEWQGQVCLIEHCTFGTALEQASDNGMSGTVRVEFSDRDFLFPAADLVFDGVQTEPQDRMRFRPLGPDRRPIAGEEYEALPMPGTRCYRSCDPQGLRLRVHTKKVRL